MMKNGISISLVLSLFFYLAYNFMPITRVLPNIAKAGFIFLALLFFVVYIMGNQRKSIIPTMSFTLSLVFIDFLIYYGVWRTNGAVVLVDKSLMLFVFWMPLLYAPFLMEETQKSSNVLFKIFLFFFIVELITTLAGNIIFPRASRTLASTQNVIQNRIYQASNIGGYGFIYSLAFSIPLWIYMWKTVSKFYIIIIVLGLLTISLASYMTAITLSLIAIVVSLSLTNRRMRFWGVLLLLLFFISKDFFTDALKSVSEMADASDNYVLAERLSSIRDVMMNEEATGDLGYRERLRADSFEAFMESPMMGNLLGEFRTLGLHSEIVDWLGGMGLTGTFTIIIIIQIRIKRYLHLFQKSPLKKYVIVSLIMCLVFSYLNVVTTAPELSSVLFILPALIYGHEEEKAHIRVLKKRL